MHYIPRRPHTGTFLGIEPTDDPDHWLLPLRKELMTARDFLYGGAGLAAGIAALEAATQRPLVWATAQYFWFARMPGTRSCFFAMRFSCAARRSPKRSQPLSPASASGRRPHAKCDRFQPVSCASATPYSDELMNHPLPM